MTTTEATMDSIFSDLSIQDSIEVEVSVPLPAYMVHDESDPLAGWDACPDCEVGFVLATGAWTPMDTRWTCSERCGWEA